jgi:hypothetical protein
LFIRKGDCVAVKMTEYTFRGRGNTRYPWGEWADGNIWRVYKGEDFQVEPSAFRASVYVHAAANGMKARTNVDGNAVTFQLIRVPVIVLND